MIKLLIIIILILTGIAFKLLDENFNNYKMLYADSSLKTPTSLLNYNNKEVSLTIRNKKAYKFTKKYTFSKNSMINLIKKGRSQVAINKIIKGSRKRYKLKSYLLIDFFEYATLEECKTEQIKYKKILYDYFNNEKIETDLFIEIKDNKNRKINKIEIEITSNNKNNFQNKKKYNVIYSEFLDKENLNTYKCTMNSESPFIINLENLLIKSDKK